MILRDRSSENVSPQVRQRDGNPQGSTTRGATTSSDGSELRRSAPKCNGAAHHRPVD